MKSFTIATLCLVFLLFLAAGMGGVWIAFALFYITGFTFLMDRMLGKNVNNPAFKSDTGEEFPASRILSALLGWAHFILLALMVWAVAGPNGFTVIERAGAFLAFGLFFGQVSHPNAHELIHRNRRKYRRLGRLVYSSLLVGHHTSAHRLVHHVHVATPKDPNSAPLGLGFYRFALRAAIGGFRQGLTAETKRLNTADMYGWQHPYIEYLSVALATLILGFSLAGVGGVLALFGIGIYTQLQILLSDYVQHYGLRRGKLADGKFEPVGPQHSWNSPHVFSSALMMNAPRHSDHHVHPSRPYPALQLDQTTMPFLPHSLPIMAMLALWPTLWRDIMNPLCEDWRPGWEGRGAKGVRGIVPEGLRSATPSGAQPRDLPSSGHENNSRPNALPLHRTAPDR